MRRLVLDTNVVLDCFGFEDPLSFPLVRQLHEGSAELASNGALHDELLRVLAYPRLPLSAVQRMRIRERYENYARPITGVRDLALPRCRDADDQKFLEAARDATADFLVTKDKALLVLVRRRSRRAPFAIVTPAEFAQRTGERSEGSFTLP